jgi:hypothetical protein
MEKWHVTIDLNHVNKNFFSRVIASSLPGKKNASVHGTFKSLNSSLS